MSAPAVRTNYFTASRFILISVLALVHEAAGDAEHRGHGYGMRSIRYVVEKYGGLMSFQTEDSIFHLNLCIPASEEPAAP